MAWLREIRSERDRSWPWWLDLWRSSFPADEREDESVLIGELRVAAPGAMRLWVVEREATPIGLVRARTISSATHSREFESTGFGFVVHLALTRENRGSGLGREVIQETIEALREDAKRLGSSYQGTVFEVEKEDPARPETAKRSAFFERLGAKVMSGSYVQPSLGEGKPRLDMDLRFLPAAACVDYAELIRLFYREAYGLGADHELTLRTIAGLG